MGVGFLLASACAGVRFGLSALEDRRFEGAFASVCLHRQHVVAMGRGQFWYICCTVWRSLWSAIKSIGLELALVLASWKACDRCWHQQQKQTASEGAGGVLLQRNAPSCGWRLKEAAQLHIVWAKDPSLRLGPERAWFHERKPVKETRFKYEPLVLCSLQSKSSTWLIPFSHKVFVVKTAPPHRW